MGIFKSLKSNKYVENMTVMSKTNLSLLQTLNELQSEYEDALKEIDRVRAELLKYKAR